MVCGERCEVYSRVVGYIRPVGQWNPGKMAEYSERVPFNQEKEVDGNLLADLSAQLLDRLIGMSKHQAHTEADWLRTNNHVLAGELLEMLATFRDTL